MCNFFSCVSDGVGNIYYFDAAVRDKIIKGELNYETDSHSSIINHYFGGQSVTAQFHKGDKERGFNKYKYNPLTKKFTVDQMNTTDDSEMVKAKCESLDFSTIVP